MKDIYKNPIFYYILVPVIFFLWPLLILTVYMPKAEKDSQSLAKQYDDIQVKIRDILIIDPERLEFASNKKTSSEFDYAVAIERIASSCGIASNNYTVNSKPSRIVNKQKIQSGQVTLKQVDIKSIAAFLSETQVRWANLQCENLSLTKNKSPADSWNADLNFNYYY